MTLVSPGAARYAALLTPQGKIVVDFIVAEAPAEDGGNFFLDCPRALAPNLVQKLDFYKLRAKVDGRGPFGKARRDGAVAGQRATANTASPSPIRVWRRSAGASCCRRISPPRPPPICGADLVEASDYDAHRIALGVPRGGLDFIYGDAFPHEADIDQLGGVDFDKGCYVGQEVVSRVEHRGSARSRVVPVAFDGGAPEAGIPRHGRRQADRHHGLDRRRARACDATSRSRGRRHGGRPVR